MSLMWRQALAAIAYAELVTSAQKCVKIPLCALSTIAATQVAPPSRPEKLTTSGSIVLKDESAVTLRNKKPPKERCILKSSSALNGIR